MLKDHRTVRVSYEDWKLVKQIAIDNDTSMVNALSIAIWKLAESIKIEKIKKL